MQAKYEAFMKAEYNVEAAVGKVGHQTEKMKQLEVLNTYNYYLYLAHYLPHLEQLETLRNIGDVNDMSWYEVLQYMPSANAEMEAQLEIGNFNSSSQIEDGLMTRVAT